MKKTATLLILLFLCTLSTYAQQAVGAVIGTIVNDMSGDEVSNAKVSIEIDGAHVKYGITDEDGNFRIYNIPEGNYDVLVTSLGFQPIKVTGVPVRKLENTEFELSFAGEGYSKDTIVVTFQEVLDEQISRKAEISKTEKIPSKKTKEQRKLERAASKLEE